MKFCESLIGRKFRLVVLARLISKVTFHLNRGKVVYRKRLQRIIEVDGLQLPGTNLG